MNKYQIMSDLELTERIECMHQINSLLTRNFSHVFHEDEAITKAVQKEIKKIDKELEERGY